MRTDNGAAIARLRRELTAGSVVVLRHVDELKPETRAMVADLLAAFESPAVVLTMSSLRDEAMQLTNALGGVEIEMPPLRNRRDDIPLLVAHFLASAAHGVMRVSPPLMRALTEADWSGNVAQLKDFVDTAAARCNFSELGTQHLSVNAAWIIDQHGTAAARKEIAYIKYYGAKVLHAVIDRVIQVNGSLGFSSDLPLEQMYRAARVPVL
jgi:transcriptional regulator of aromatic amino acid metabolism